MGRIRTIKPDFFLSEGLGELSPLHRLLFVGLWTLADREGRLEDRPARIKIQVLPWDDCDVDQLLSDLDAAGYVHRYEAAGVACIAIPGFVRHQRPHPKEAAFGYPAPPSREVPRKAVKKSVESRVAAGGKGREGKESQEGKGREPAPLSAATAPDATTLELKEQSAGQKPPRRRSEAQQFWDHYQAERERLHGWISEAEVDAAALNAWFSRAMGELGGVQTPPLERLWAAGAHFLLEDRYWTAPERKSPFRAFMKDENWRKHVPRERTHEAGTG